MPQLYALVENRPGNEAFGQPFYIGVGQTKRPRHHLYNARAGKHYNEDMQKVISRHFSAGVRPIIRTLVIGEHEYLYDLEKKAVALYGRRRRPDERGLLCNVSKGGAGPDTELMSDPKILAKVSAATKALFDRPGYREAHGARSKAAYASQELRDRVGAATKAALAKPENRAKLLAALDRVHAKRTPEQYRQYAQKARDNHPERAEADRQRMIARQAAISADPVRAAKRTADIKRAVKAIWADPEQRAARIKSLRGVKKTSTPAWKAARTKAVAAMQAAKRAKKELRLQAEAIVNQTRTSETT
jgi:hypothetical protein